MQLFSRSLLGPGLLTVQPMTQKNRHPVCHIRKVHGKDHTHAVPLCLPEQQRGVADVNISMEKLHAEEADSWFSGDRSIKSETTGLLHGLVPEEDLNASS